MSMKVYDISESILQNGPRIRLRGKLYRLRDMLIEERLRLAYEAQQEEESLEEIQDVETRLRRQKQLIARSVQSALVDLPPEVAESITELEFALLHKAIEDARKTEVDLVVKSLREVEEESGNSSAETSNS